MAFKVANPNVDLMVGTANVVAIDHSRRAPAVQCDPFRQFRDVGGDAPCLILGEPLGGAAPDWLLRVLDVGERLIVGIGDDETLSSLVDLSGAPRIERVPSRADLWGRQDAQAVTVLFIVVARHGPRRPAASVLMAFAGSQ